MYTPAILFYVGAASILYFAMSTLGPIFSPSLQIAKEHTLITSGIYGHMRHPMYTAALLILIGQSLLLPSAAGWISAIIAFALLLFIRIPAEETMMIAEFGNEYRDYMNHVRALF